MGTLERCPESSDNGGQREGGANWQSVGRVKSGVGSESVCDSQTLRKGTFLREISLQPKDKGPRLLFLNKDPSRGGGRRRMSRRDSRWGTAGWDSPCRELLAPGSHQVLQDSLSGVQCG